MFGDIETLQRQTVMTEIEQLIQSTPEYADVREALYSLNFVPERDDAEIAVWVQPDLGIFVLLRMNPGGGYAGYRVAAYEDREEASPFFSAR
ncbi:MAG: hypothetical protein WCY70_01570 [Methanoculleus sp.]